jgi:proteasome inhibitor subunit 1 (PI31)
MPDPLEANHILELLPTLLPRSTSSPLPHTTDALAALVHTIHTALAFRLIRPTNEEASEPAGEVQHDFDDGASETTTAVDQDEAEGDVEGRLWTGWNHRAEDSYSFEYKHQQSSMTFRLRVGRMGGRVQIDAMAEVRYLTRARSDRQDGAPHTISVVVRDLLEPGSFPIPSSATSEGSTNNSESPAKSLGFTSDSR